jgi:hypothetical protein
VKIINNTPTLWTMECKDLAGRAWTIRRNRASALDVPVSMIPWRSCLLQAKAIEAAELAKECWEEANESQAFGYAFYAPTSPVAPVSRSTLVTIASYALIAAMALLVA